MHGNRLRTGPGLRGISLLACLVGIGVLAGPAAAQRLGPTYPAPRLLVITPSGGQAGTTFEMTVSGVDVGEPQQLLFSQPGIKAELIGSSTAPRPDPQNRRPGRGRQRPLTTDRFKVTIPANTPLGIHDVRVVNHWGVSNPRAFVVGDLPEVLEKEPNNDVDQAQRVELNSTVHGSISAPTDVDYFVFAGKKGQRVLVSCLASSIDSRLLPALQLYDATGKMLASDRNYHDNDALLDCTLPADGDYRVRVFGFTYTQGSAEHFYRLTITTGPWIDAIYPPMVEPGTPTKVTVYGRNLPGGQPDPEAVVDGQVLEKMTVTVEPPKNADARRLTFRGRIDPKSSSLDGFEFRVRSASGTSNPYLLTFAQAPVVLDNGANDDAEHAQEVSLPCEIAGRIEKRRDHDWYTFHARKGEVYSIEGYADRLGSPINLYFALRGGARKQTLAESADNNDNLSPVQFFTRNDDPQRYRFTAPADGPYYLMVSSREASIQSGPRDQYRIRITPERPDFRLVVMPPSANSPEGCTLYRHGNQYYTVFVWRLDGFSGDVTVRAEGLPPGVTCVPQTIGGTQKQGALALTASTDAKPWTGSIRVAGTATINGEEVVREARPATITWPVPPQQNVATISRLDRDLALAVRDEAPFVLTAKTAKEAMVLPGQRVTVTLKLTRAASEVKAPVQVTVLNLPPNVVFNGNNNQPLNVPPGKDEINAVLDVRPNAQPGTYTALFRAQTQVMVTRDAKTKQKQTLVLAQPSNPVTVTVLPRQVARVTVRPGNAALKAGKEAEVVVHVERLYNYAGEFKVELVVPSGTKGIEAEEVTIPKGKDQATLVIKAASDASPGNRGNLVVRATALVNGKVPTTQEVKLNVSVGK